jgi:hypothetical protein
LDNPKFSLAEDGGNKEQQVPEISNARYAALLPHFTEAWNRLAAVYTEVKATMVAFRDEFFRKFGARIIPYLKAFVRDKLNELNRVSTRKTRVVEDHVDSELQSVYVPESQGPSDGIYLPAEQADAIRSAMFDLKMRLAEDYPGGVDEFVMKELGYGSLEEMWRGKPDVASGGLAGYQIDALALAIDSAKRGEGFVIGDDTGVGKGRVAAGMIAWAVKNGKVPIFFSFKDDLYSDMRRDLDNIGFPDIKFIITNTNSKVKNQADEVVYQGSSSKAEADMRFIIENGRLPREANVLFTTYSQIQTPSRRRDAIDALVRSGKATLVLDESHAAAGESGRNAYMMRLLTGEGLFGGGEGVEAIPLPEGWAPPATTYLSATFAKRAGNLPAYVRTSIRYAADTPEDLKTIFQGGGRVLLEIVSKMLVNAGQMIRRERSYANIKIDYKVDTANELRDSRAVDATTDVLRSLMFADRALSEWLTDTKNQQALVQAIAPPGYMAAPQRPGQRQSQLVDKSPFTSIVHNYIAQLLLSTKVESATTEAVEALKRGEKPIITLYNTREAALTGYMEAQDLQTGAEVPDYNWRSSLQQGLNNTLRVNLISANGARVKVRIPMGVLAQLAPTVYHEYQSAQKRVNAYRTDLPASPIDMLRKNLGEYSVYHDASGRHVVKASEVPPGVVAVPIRASELTGRELLVDYTGVPTIRSRKDPSTLDVVREFNRGDIDALILNTSGSTGISLHASEVALDQSVRHMIILQPAPDISQFKQILGRINRTGQVEWPLYTAMATAIPAEKRPLAMLEKKMALLSANTSATNRNATNIEGTTDFINEYGDVAVNAWLREHPDTAALLNLDTVDDDENVPDDFALKASGRIALLMTEQQKQFYDAIEQAYNDDIAMRNAAGTNRLVRRALPLNASPIEENVLVEGENQDNPFQRDAYLTKYEVDIVGKPPTADAVRQQVLEALGGRSSEQVIEQIESDLTLVYEEARNQRTLTIQQLTNERNGSKVTEKEKEDLDRRINAAQEDLKKFGERREKTLGMLRQYQIGQGGVVRFNDVESYAVVTGYRVNKVAAETGNPYAPSHFVITFQRNIPGLALPIPLSKLEKMQNFRGGIWHRHPDIDHEFRDRAEFTGREERYIATKNIPVALGQLQGMGEIISFTQKNGETEDGILLPPSYRPGNLAEIDYAIRSPEHATAYLLAVARAFAERMIAKSPNWSQSARAELAKIQAAQGPNPTAFQLVQDDKPYHLTLFSKRRIVQIQATDYGEFTIAIDKRHGAKWIRSKALTAIIGDLGSRRSSDFASKSFDASKLQAVVRWARANMPLYVLSSQKERARQFLPAAPTLALDWTTAETAVATPFARNGLPIEQVERFASALRAQWKNAPPAVVVRSARELPFPAPATTRGAYWNGTVYLVAQNLASNDAVQFVILHETLGHYGLKGVLGDQLKTMMQRIYKTNPTIRKMADERRAFYKSRGRELDIETAAEEALADLAGSGRWSTISGWQMLFAAIRSALRKLGFTLGLSNAEVAILLGNARRYVRELERPAAPAPDSGPLFSLTTDGIMGAIKQEVLDRFAFDGKSMSWINRTINTQFHKAETNAYYRPVYQGVQHYISDVNSMANDAADLAGENVLPRMRDIADVGFNPFKFSNWQKERQLQKDLRSVGQVIWAATLGDMRPTEGELRNGFTATVRDSKGDVIGQVQAPALTDAQLDHYLAIRATIDLSLDQGAASEMVKIARESAMEQKIPSIEEARQAAKDDPQNAAQILTGALQERLQTIEDMRTSRTLSPNEADKFKALTETMISAIEDKEALVRKLQDQGYAPLMRFGQYTVKVMVPETRTDGGIDENVLYFGMFESQKDANRMGREMLAELQQEHPQAILVNGTMDTEAWKQMRGLSIDTLEAFAAITGIDKDEAVQNFLKMAIASRSAMKRLIHRKGIKGYDEDIQRVLATFVTSQARLAARNYHFGELVKATNAIPQEMGDVRAEAAQLTGYVQNPAEEAQGIRGFLFTQFLGGSIASALTNITQPVLMTLPYLSQFEPGTGFKGALAAPGAAAMALTKALKVVLAKGTEDATLREAMDLAAAEGKTEPQEIHQLYAESIRSGLGGRNLQARKALRLWGSMFSLSESFNRKITFIAAFELARAPGAIQEINAKRAAVGRPPFKDAYEFAVNAIDETQGIYNKGNRPNWARGGVGATIFTFKQFSIAYVEFLSRLPAREKAIALAILVTAAGAEGLPFADDLTDLWDTIWQAMGFSSNAKKSIRSWATKTLGEAGGGFLTGGLSNVPGSPIDVSGRLGVGNLVPGTALFARSTQDATREIAQAVGPIGSVLMSARQAISAAEEGQLKSAAFNVVPKAIRDAMQAADMWQAGYYRDLKGRRTVETTGVDAAFKFIGLMPYDVAKEAKHRQDIQQDIALHNVVEASIADRWARGIVEKDQDAIEAAIKDLFAWNLRNPTAPIAITPQQIRQRVQSALMPAEARLLRQTPRELRGREFGR